MCRFEPSYLAVTICKDSESSAKGHRLPHDKKRLDSVYWNRGQKCKVVHWQHAEAEIEIETRNNDNNILSTLLPLSQRQPESETETRN